LYLVSLPESLPLFTEHPDQRNNIHRDIKHEVDFKKGNGLNVCALPSTPAKFMLKS
jgi:hypothetical protein